MSRIFASVWSIAMVCRMYKQGWKNFYLFFLTLLYTIVYTTAAQYKRPGTHIALRPLNQDENKLMIYVLLNIHEGNPWLMWGKNEETKMLLMGKSGQNIWQRNLRFFFCGDWKEMSFKAFLESVFKCLEFGYLVISVEDDTYSIISVSYTDANELIDRFFKHSSYLYEYKSKKLLCKLSSLSRFFFLKKMRGVNNSTKLCRTQ